MTQQDDDGESDDSYEMMAAPKKLKADTDTRNLLYLKTIKERKEHTASLNYLRMNRDSLKTISHGNLPKPRIDVPDNFEVHPYGNQK